MSSKNLRSFEEQARNVGYAYEETQRQYDEHPPRRDRAPIAADINAWALICGCYMGIEQTMKLLIKMGGRIPEEKEKKELRGHDLVKLYSLLDPSERKVVSNYYRVYRSLHNFDIGCVALETADEFIRYIGSGYEVWRYILFDIFDIEKTKKPPKTHLGLMLETWRALADLVEHSASGRNYPYRTLEGYLEDYIDKVLSEAEADPEWQAAPKFSEIREWAKRKGGDLKAGIDLFHHHARGAENFIKDSPLMSRVLLRAADKAMRGLIPTRRQADIAMFHYRIRVGGLAWNADERVFESCPATGFDQKK